MSAATEHIAALDAALADVGEDVTLQRIAPDPAGETYLSETADGRAAVRIGKAPDDLVDPEMGDFAIVISPSSLLVFGVPRLFDLIETQAAALVGVKSVSPIYVAGELVRVDLVARGGSWVLDKRLTIRRASYTENALGERVADWFDMLPVWASKEDTADAERFATQEVAATITSRFRIRYSAGVADVTPADRVVCDDRVFGIVAVKEIGRREGLEITASARAD